MSAEAVPDSFDGGSVCATNRGAQRMKEEGVTRQDLNRALEHGRVSVGPDGAFVRYEDEVSQFELKIQLTNVRGNWRVTNVWDLTDAQTTNQPTY